MNHPNEVAPDAPAAESMPAGPTPEAPAVEQRPKPSAPSFWSRIPFWVKIGVPAAIVVGGIVAACVVVANQPTKFEAAVEECGISSGYTWIGDEGKTITVHVEEGGEDGLETAACVLETLDVSDAILSEMSATRGLGKQTSEWGDINVTWVIDSNEGLDVILTQD